VVVTVSELQRIRTSGARAVESFRADGLDLIAIPQLAVDVVGTEPGMNAGDSNTDMLVFVRRDGKYVEHSTIAAPGGEDAEFFTIDERSFLAAASIRRGAGPYEYTVESTIHEWIDGALVPFQAIETHAAKQWRHWRIGERHFLGMAQGVALPHIAGPNRDSMVYEWNGEKFVEFQTIPSTWAYNWHPFWVDDLFFVAHADHIEPSRLYRWDGTRLVEHQELRNDTGRAFASFERDGEHYLIVVGLTARPEVLRWDGQRFVPMMEFGGLGAREACVIERGGRLFVVVVKFITGTPADPHPEHTSHVYEWNDGAFEVVAEFPTCGATDVEVVEGSPDDVRFIVSNSLSPDLRFANDTIVYSMSVSSTSETGN
jgi:hypothetical protein